MKGIFKKTLSMILCFLIVLPMSGISFSSTAAESTRGVCLADIECVDEGHYTGNEGDSRVFRLDAGEFNGYEPRGYYEGGTQVTKRNGNTGLDGTIFENGFEVWIARWNFGDNISWAYRTFKLDGKYQTLTGKSSIIKSYNTKSFNDTVYFYNDQELIYSFNLTPTN